jgi:Ca2+/Na+ antiporter
MLTLLSVVDVIGSPMLNLLWVTGNVSGISPMVPDNQSMLADGGRCSQP